MFPCCAFQELCISSNITINIYSTPPTYIIPVILMLKQDLKKKYKGYTMMMQKQSRTWNL
jgi:hypothetical protein